MAKDRYHTKASWNNDFKYGVYECASKVKRDVTSTQVDLIKTMLKSNKITNWEKDFLEGVIRFNVLSIKQKIRLNKIYIKIKYYYGR